MMSIYNAMGSILRCNIVLYVYWLYWNVQNHCMFDIDILQKPFDVFKGDFFGVQMMPSHPAV